uniref:Serpentine receptor class gamma n=1 Tax=Heligmosomoides polygyrus TaxID=6339 RepID=A0A183F3F6_HELPZ
LFLYSSTDFGSPLLTHRRKFQNIFYFLFDFIMTRILVSGLITGWLTTLPVGAYLTAIYILLYHMQYMTFYSATSISVLRTIAIYSNSNRVRWTFSKIKKADFLTLHLVVVPLLGYCVLPHPN